MRTCFLFLTVFVLACGGCEFPTAAESCCDCLRENVCILSSDEETCVSDLEAGDNPDRNERPFGEGIAVNEDCVETQCGDCINTALDASESGGS